MERSKLDSLLDTLVRTGLLTCIEAMALEGAALNSRFDAKFEREYSTECLSALNELLARK